MNAKQKTLEIMRILPVEWSAELIDAADVIRRSALTIQRRHELECGISDVDGWTQAIERDEKTGALMMRRMGRMNGVWVDWSTPTRDTYTPAIKRARAAAASVGLEIYVQTDPRGCPLYVAPHGSGLDHETYQNGVGIPAVRA